MIIKSSLQTDGRNIREVLHRAIDQEIHLPLENSELFVQSARAAVGFSVLLRCGYNIDEYYDDFDFDFEMLPIHQKYEMFKNNKFELFWIKVFWPLIRARRDIT